MDLAKCVLDNKIYNAKDFAKVDGFEEKSKNLICLECGHTAFFRRPSISGQGACFGSRPHGVGCKLGASSSEKLLGHLEESEKEIINSGDRIKVDFKFGSESSSHITETENENEVSNNLGKNHSCKNGTKRSSRNRRLKSLLNMLIHDVNFAISSQKIDVGYKHPYYASNLFKRHYEISSEDIGKFRGVYGVVVSIRIQEDSFWINFSGENKDFSILINDKSSFLLRFKKYKDINEIVGLYVLCFGDIKLSLKNKPYIKLDSISKIAFK
ncbi:hypothetical protein [Francisella uliginis]|uniref:Uncharacterized protein n=1 Tax=Francisella uliginis TaxID=573570 RepID=A0A1L4BS53_9GAMM|nr:hypothetical protein [Francisella uliginis]API86667.1 hypothetical protein F7310_04525 [Francisella uliginis]